MAKRTKRSFPAAQDLEDFAIAIAIIGGVASQLPSFFPPDNPDESPAKLLWLLGPALAAAWIISRGGWWKKVGLGFNLKRAGVWSLASIGLPLLLAGVLVFLSESTGAAKVKEVSFPLLIETVSPLAAMILAKNLVEEFCFRGFFTSRFEDSRFAGLAGHILTGVIWGIWHLPYWLVFLGPERVEMFSSMPLSYFIALGFVILPLQSIFYGELRLLSGSIWPPILFHTLTNLVTFALIDSAFVVPDGIAGAVLSPGSHGLLYSIILGGLGLLLMIERKGKLVWDSPEKRAAAKKRPKKSSKKAKSTKKSKAPAQEKSQS